MPVCPRWRTARCDQLNDSIQVWRPVVESAWCELSSSPQEGWGLSLPGPVSSSTPPHQGVSLTGSLYLVQFNSSSYILSLSNSHAHAHYRKVQRLLPHVRIKPREDHFLDPAIAHGKFMSHRKKVVCSLVVRSQDFRDE